MEVTFHKKTARRVDNDELEWRGNIFIDKACALKLWGSEVD
jgi:hypothetical protein